MDDQSDQPQDAVQDAVKAVQTPDLPQGRDLFDAEVNGHPHEAILHAEATFQGQVTALGGEAEYKRHGGAALASTQSEEARQKLVDRRIFLKRLGWGAAFTLSAAADSFLGGGILWHVLEGEERVPTLPSLLDPDVSPTLKINEADWEFLELQASAALSRRDFVALNELIVSTLDPPLFKQLLRAISFNAQGHIGEAFRIIDSFEHKASSSAYRTA